MATDRFKIGDRTYETGALDEITLRDLMLFNTEAAPFGVAWADVERIVAEMADMGDEGIGHPDVLLMVGVTVWAARRAAGDNVTFEQAVDVPMSAIVWLESPKDHRKAASKKPRKASDPAAELPAVDTSAVVTPTT